MSATLIALSLFADAAAAAALPKKDKSDPDRLICRRELKTGSLVQTTRTCRTKREWEEIANAGRRDVDELRDRSKHVTTN
jgi:hypothetical protein